MSSTTAAPSGAAPREQWTGQVGFIISAIGSAVGLGNIWRFPGVAYENGGGAFLIPYLVALVTAGIPILFLDYAIGHRFRGSAPTVFRRIGGRFGRWTESLGWFQAAIPFVIGLYYTVIIAWAASYFVFSFDQRWGADPVGFFTKDYLHAADAGVSMDFVPGILIPLVVIWIVTIGVMVLGVAKGLQRLNAIFLPLLAVGFTILVVRALFLPGAADGLNQLFTPDWQKLGDPSVWMAAYSQIFFSLSIAFGIMITYASYRRRKSNLTTPGLVVAFANSSFEILAGIGVFAALGFYATQQGVPLAELPSLAGVGLSFMTFPMIVSQMPGGALFGCLFFGSLAVAGFTSLVSVLQVVVAAVQEKFGLTRQSAAIGVGVVSAVLSVLLFSTTTGLSTLDVVDHFANNIGVVSSAIIMTVLVVWVLRRGKELSHHLTSLSTFAVGPIWRLLIGVVAPIVLAYMLINELITLGSDGYGGYPTWYVVVLGWGAVAVIVIAAVVMPMLRWRHPVDDFTPWPPFPPVDTRDARKKEAVR